eukprot:g3142.t1
MYPPTYFHSKHLPRPIPASSMSAEFAAKWNASRLRDKKEGFSATSSSPRFISIPPGLNVSSGDRRVSRDASNVEHEFEEEEFDKDDVVHERESRILDIPPPGLYVRPSREDGVGVDNDDKEEILANSEDCRVKEIELLLPEWVPSNLLDEHVKKQNEREKAAKEEEGARQKRDDRLIDTGERDNALSQTNLDGGTIAGSSILAKADKMLEKIVDRAVTRGTKMAETEAKKHVQRRNIYRALQDIQYEGHDAVVAKLRANAQKLERKVLDARSRMSESKQRVFARKRSALLYLAFDTSYAAVTLMWAIATEDMRTKENSRGGEEEEEDAALASSYLLHRDISEVSDAIDLAIKEQSSTPSMFHAAELRCFVEQSTVELELITKNVASQNEALVAELAGHMSTTISDATAMGRAVEMQNVANEGLQRTLRSLRLVCAEKRKALDTVVRRIASVKRETDRLKKSMPANSLHKLNPKYQERYRQEQLREVEAIERRRRELADSFSSIRGEEMRNCREEERRGYQDALDKIARRVKSLEQESEKKERSRVKMKEVADAVRQHEASVVQGTLDRFKGGKDEHRALQRKLRMECVDLDEIMIEKAAMTRDLRKRAETLRYYKARLASLRDHMKARWLHGDLTSERYGALLIECCSKRSYSAEVARQYKSFVARLRLALPLKFEAESLLRRRETIERILGDIRHIAADPEKIVRSPPSSALKSVGIDDMSTSAVGGDEGACRKRVRGLKKQLELEYAEHAGMLAKLDEELAGVVRKLEIQLGIPFVFRRVEVARSIRTERARLAAERFARRGRPLLDLDPKKWVEGCVAALVRNGGVFVDRGVLVESSSKDGVDTKEGVESNGQIKAKLSASSPPTTSRSMPPMGKSRMFSPLVSSPSPAIIVTAEATSMTSPPSPQKNSALSMFSQVVSSPLMPRRPDTTSGSSKDNSEGGGYGRSQGARPVGKAGVFRAIAQ